MIDVNRPVKTISGLDVRNLKKEINSCNCSLSKSGLTGEVLVNSLWHRTKWHESGVNVSGIQMWNIKNV